MTRRPLAALAALALAFGMSACGDDEPTTGAAGTETTAEQAASEFPVTIGDVTVEERPERIVVLTPTGTETLFAIGAGDQVIAVDDNSNHPEEAPTTDLSAFDPNVEAIAAYEPDLVVASNDTNDLVAGLEALDIPVLLQEAPAEIEQVYDYIDDLGRATGNVENADELVAQMRSDIEEIVAGAEGIEGMTYYYELDPTYYSVTSKTFIGKLLGLLGLESIADEADAEAGDYPQLSAEYIVDADPDLVLLADTKCCDQDAAAVAARPGWSGMTAVEGDGVVELDDDIASRWGPRIVDLLRTVADAAERAAA